MDNLIIFGSMTPALRARDILKKAGIHSRLVRTPSKPGKKNCGYSLAVDSNIDKAVSLIKEKRIPFSGTAAADHS